jgi:hypothetical protein
MHNKRQEVLEKASMVKTARTADELRQAQAVICLLIMVFHGRSRRYIGTSPGWAANYGWNSLVRRRKVTRRTMAVAIARICLEEAIS